jgi:hypothetical protein
MGGDISLEQMDLVDLDSHMSPRSNALSPLVLASVVATSSNMTWVALRQTIQ